MTIKTMRQEKELTQQQASELTGIPLRTYKTYENDPTKEGTIKYLYIQETLRRYGLIDEEHGIQSIDKIRKICAEVFIDRPVEFCILFGSYANGNATEHSDIDLLVSTELHGLQFFGLAETLREKLHKKIDLLDIRQIEGNEELLHDILKEGVRIYVQK